MAVAAHRGPRREWHSDRASLASQLGQQRTATLAMFCTAWPVRQGRYVPQSACPLDGERSALRCPGGESMPCAPGGVVKCPAATCQHCVVRERCTASASGRSGSIPPDAAVWQEWRELQQTPQGRAKLHERGAVEHALAHVGHWQGRRARARGVRKKVFDLRRWAVMHNLHVFASLTERTQQAA